MSGTAAMMWVAFTTILLQGLVLPSEAAFPYIPLTGYSSGLDYLTGYRSGNSYIELGLDNSLGDQQPANWTSPDGCIVATMGMMFKMPKDPCSPDTEVEISVDPTRNNLTVSGGCAKDTSSKNETLILIWSDLDKSNNKTMLARSIMLTFTKNDTSDTYGISQIMGTVDVMFRGKKIKAMLWGDFKKEPLLSTPLNNSYTCDSQGPVDLTVHWGVQPNCSATTTTTTTTTTKSTTTTTTKSTSTTTTKSTTTSTPKSTTTTTTKRTTTTKSTTTTTTKSTTTTATKSTSTTTPKSTTTTNSTTTVTPKSTTTTTLESTTTTAQTNTTTNKTKAYVNTFNKLISKRSVTEIPDADPTNPTQESTTATTPKSTTTTITKSTTTTTTKSTSTTTKSTTTTTNKSTTTTTTKSTTTTTTKSTTTTTTKSTTTTTTKSTTTTTTKSTTTTTTKSTTTTTTKSTTTTTTKSTTTTSTKSTTTTLPKSTTTTTPKPKQDKTTLELTKIQFDAFRSSKTDKTDFQEPSPCPSGGGNDLVPIIVGCVLASMVVVVLVAYLVGRRYRANKYQEMEESQ